MRWIRNLLCCLILFSISCSGDDTETPINGEVFWDDGDPFTNGSMLFDSQRNNRIGSTLLNVDTVILAGSNQFNITIDVPESDKISINIFYFDSAGTEVGVDLTSLDCTPSCAGFSPGRSYDMTIRVPRDFE